MSGRRKRAMLLFAFIAFFLIAVAFSGFMLSARAMETDLTRRDQPPSLQHPFGTDWLGRDMMARTLCGLSLSLGIGCLTALASALIALGLGALAALGGRWADACVTWVIDLLMGIPHILLLILIAFACGRGLAGVIVGITLTHWMSLARVLRGEIWQLNSSVFIGVARKLGAGRVEILKRHMLPHLLPQWLTGLTLLFPHAILHEASVTFLGFGLPPEQPAIGIILSESLRYLMLGEWWLALFPGLLLVLSVLLFDAAANALRVFLDPLGGRGERL